MKPMTMIDLTLAALAAVFAILMLAALLDECAQWLDRRRRDRAADVARMRASAAQAECRDVVTREERMQHHVQHGRPWA